jgi:hypothetical protein
VPFPLTLPEPWASRGWKAKIRDRERVEPPHVTILFKTSAWRFGLRTGTFLDKEPNPNEVPEEVMGAVGLNLALLREEWDRMYPENCIASTGQKKKRKGGATDE